MITNILRTNDDTFGIDITAFDLSDICNTTIDARPNGHCRIIVDGVARRYIPRCFSLIACDLKFDGITAGVGR